MILRIKKDGSLVQNVKEKLAIKFCFLPTHQNPKMIFTVMNNTKLSNARDAER